MLFVLISSNFLTNCSGSSNSDDSDPDPCDMDMPAITTNSPVTAGTNIELNTPYLSTMAEYYWTGPNGFVSFGITLSSAG